MTTQSQAGTAKFTAALFWKLQDKTAEVELVAALLNSLSYLSAEEAHDVRDRLGDVRPRQNGMINIGPGSHIAGLMLFRAAQTIAISISNDRGELLSDRRSIKEEFLRLGVSAEEFDRVVDLFGLRPLLSESAKQVASKFF